jgi:leucine dehydrogenase
MVYVNMETSNVVGLPGRSGDPSPYTALGTFRSMQACCEKVLGDKSLKGRTVALQGTGNVGYHLCRLLHEDGASLIVSDINAESVARVVKEFGAKAVGVDEIYGAACDVYAPCALGATVNDQTIPQFKCKIVCGAANNILKDPAVHGKALHDLGITYAPDYLANAGGVINVFYELAESGYHEEAALRDIDYIYNRMLDVLTISAETGALPHETADRLAEKRVESVRNIRSIMTRRA